MVCGCTNITALRWMEVSASTLYMIGGLPERSLPRLRKLRFDRADDCTLPLLTSMLSSLRPACPNVQHLVWNATLSDVSMANLWKLRDACPSLLYLRAAMPAHLRIERSQLKRLPYQVQQAESPTADEREEQLLDADD